ncbi:hypothetical protein [Methanothrix sp.]|uniref:hypothetical protein n=1 Tax=Methanothrix sp. TaxID=90426 RepID=UPI003296E2D7
MPGPYKMPFALECEFLLHASPTLGYRFDLEGKIIAYCPDTGVCEGAVQKVGLNSFRCRQVQKHSGAY